MVHRRGGTYLLALDRASNVWTKGCDYITMSHSSELALRRQVLGRRNWLFCGSDQGAEVNTLWVSLLASCRLHRIEPLSYLRDLLCLLPRWPASQVLQLAPLFWSHTLQQPQTQQWLRENLLREALLSELP